MSCDEEDYRYEDAMLELYGEHKEQAIEEFKSDRLRAYYGDSPAVAQPARAYLADARELLDESPNAALILAAVSAEYFFKRVLLDPIVRGLVTDEAVADLVADLALGHTGLDRFKGLLVSILDKVAGIDLMEYRREDSKAAMWQEWKELQARRNRLVHRAEQASQDQAATAVEVAAELLEAVFPRVVDALGLHLHPDGDVCAERRCIERDRLGRLLVEKGLRPEDFDG